MVGGGGATVVDGGGAVVVRGGGGAVAVEGAGAGLLTGTPRLSPLSGAALGNVSFGVPANAPSMVDFQMSEGSPEPYTRLPVLSCAGVRSTVVTVLAVHSDGVQPTIQPLAFWPVSFSCAVPVLAADARPAARS